MAFVMCHIALLNTRSYPGSYRALWVPKASQDLIGLHMPCLLKITDDASSAVAGYNLTIIQSYLCPGPIGKAIRFDFGPGQLTNVEPARLMTSA